MPDIKYIYKQRKQTEEPLKRAKTDPSDGSVTTPTDPIIAQLPLHPKAQLRGDSMDLFTAIQFHPTEPVLLSTCYLISK
mgnify:CR=1 FL=1